MKRVRLPLLVLVVAGLLAAAPASGLQVKRIKLPEGCTDLYVPPAASPDGGVWFGCRRFRPARSGVAYVSPGGKVSGPFLIRTHSSGGNFGLAVSTDGTAWLNPLVGSVLRVSTEGKISRIALPRGTNSGLDGLVAGPSGSLWVGISTIQSAPGKDGAVGLISSSGQLATFPLEDGYLPTPLLSGSNGEAHFGGSGYGTVASDGKRTYLKFARGGLPRLVTPDGAIYFSRSEEKQVVRLAASGALTQFPLLARPLGGPLDVGHGLVLGPDGLPWAVTFSPKVPWVPKLLRFASDGSVQTVARAVTGRTFSAPSPAVGSSVWITESPSGATGISVREAVLARVNAGGAVRRYSIDGSAIRLGSPLPARDGVLWVPGSRSDIPKDVRAAGAWHPHVYRVRGTG